MMQDRLPVCLVLASGSPYRRELLGRLRLPFDVKISDIDEQPHCGETPRDTAIRLACAKALAIAADSPGSVVIGSDQVATLDGRQIGKPGTHANALQQLRTMRGRSVVFYTAVSVVDSRTKDASGASAVQCTTVQTLVKFRDLPDDELDAYLRMETPYDCAGSAKIEGLGIMLIEEAASTDPTALIGLPLIALTGMLRNIGISPIPG